MSDASEPDGHTDGYTELVDAFLTASRVLVAISVRSVDAAEPEVTLAQHRILVLLASRGPQRVGDLAAELGVNQSVATRHCDRLQRAGVVERHRSQDDARAVRISLSEAGRNRLDRVTQTRREEIATIVDAMPAAHHTQVLASLRSFNAAAGEPADEAWVTRGT